MGRHLTSETKEKIHELVAQGMPQKRIRLRLNITENQLKLELRKMRVPIEKKEFPGLTILYEKLQNSKNKGDKSGNFRLSRSDF